MAETCAEKNARLATYEAARDALATGQRIVRLRHGDKDLEYDRANANMLFSLIRELRADIARNCGGNRSSMTYIIPTG